MPKQLSTPRVVAIAVSMLAICTPLSPITFTNKVNPPETEVKGGFKVKEENLKLRFPFHVLVVRCVRIILEVVFTKAKSLEFRQQFSITVHSRHPRTIEA